MSSKGYRLVGFLIILLTLFCALLYSFRSNITDHDYRASYHAVYTTTVTGRKAAFVKGFVATEIDGSFDGSTLQSLCSSREWTPGLIFKCDAPMGGVAIVRNVFLNCVRFAIEAGATSFIVPEIRGPGDYPLPFEHLFDLEHFTHSLNTSCPQMKIMPQVNELWKHPSTANPLVLDTSALSTKFVEGVIGSPWEWHAAFHKHLNETHPRKFDANKPVLVVLQRPLLQFPLSYDDPHLVANFGKLLKFKTEVRNLAGAVLYAMDEDYELGIDAEKNGVRLGQFYGAHLRTTSDAIAAGWTPYEIQATNYLSHANRTKLNIIYVVSGNGLDVKTLAETAGNMSITVTSRDMLLSKRGFEKEREDLQAMTWEQRLLVDYEVLLRSAAFGGTHESSLAWNIAMRRHVVIGHGSWTEVGGEGVKVRSIQQFKKDQRSMQESSRRKMPTTEAPTGSGRIFEQSFSDQLSVVFGPLSEGRMFQLSMWP
ncbi:hypothetical protein BJ875DRAFT_511524 [Amylocarpus encephaloides]|uniref:Alternative oxidase n=1 Tax=Amylocarpus encephaloides TaxID=45428 RepID=A0A9P7YHG5_9HELO|nr:hypothetical protein BJ875DRAFT_511524 [Amylocarpus encephaloides]